MVRTNGVNHGTKPSNQIDGELEGDFIYSIKPVDSNHRHHPIREIKYFTNHWRNKTMPPPAPKKEELSQTKASSSSTAAATATAAAVLDNTLETIPNSDNSDSSSSSSQQQRQVIAVSVSKGPSAFFNLARKFLVTDEECDLSALEGAIVSAVDAAHLLERSQIATISRCVFE